MENHGSSAIESHRKERGIRGRKAELIHALEATKLIEQKSNIFDEPIPNVPTPVYNQHLEDHQILR